MSNVASLGAVAATSLLLIRRRRRRLAAEKLRRLTARRFWVRCWLLRRPEYGLFEKLVHELARDDKAGFRNFLRVEPDLFLELLHRVRPRIEKQLTFMRKPLARDGILVIWVCRNVNDLSTHFSRSVGGFAAEPDFFLRGFDSLPYMVCWNLQDYSIKTNSQHGTKLGCTSPISSFGNGPRSRNSIADLFHETIHLVPGEIWERHIYVEKCPGGSVTATINQPGVTVSGTESSNPPDNASLMSCGGGLPGYSSCSISRFTVQETAGILYTFSTNSLGSTEKCFTDYDKVRINSGEPGATCLCG